MPLKDLAKRKEYSRKYHIANAEKIRARVAKWQAEVGCDPELHAKHQRKYRAKDPAVCREAVRRSQYSLPKGWYVRKYA